MGKKYRIDAGYIKSRRLMAEKVTVAYMKQLVLAFIGYNERLTRQFFGEFAMDNSEQIRKADFVRGRIEFYDGTIIRRIDAGMAGRMDGWRFDQIIVADDYRMNARISRIDELQVLDCLCGRSEVPVDFRYLYYNVDGITFGV